MKREYYVNNFKHSESYFLKKLEPTIDYINNQEKRLAEEKRILERVKTIFYKSIGEDYHEYNGTMNFSARNKMMSREQYDKIVEAVSEELLVNYVKARNYLIDADILSIKTEKGFTKLTNVCDCEEHVGTYMLDRIGKLQREIQETKDLLAQAVIDGHYHLNGSAIKTFKDGTKYND